MAVSELDYQLQKPLPPLLKGAPILGSARTMLKDPLAFMVDAYHKMGPIYRFRSLHLEYTVLSGPEANQFLSRDAEGLLSVEEVYSGIAEGMDTTHFLLSQNGERHKELRRILRPGYSKQAVASHMDQMVRLVDEMADDVRREKRILVVPAFKRLVISQLGELLMGRRPDGYFEDLQAFFTITAETSVVPMLPKFVTRLPYFRGVQKRLFALSEEVIAAHRARIPTAETHDVVDDVLEARDEQGNPYPEDFLRAAVIGTYIAGIDTVALTCAFALYALLKHGIYQRVREDVLAHWQEPVTSGMFRTMKVLHAAYLEIMRYYPVGPGAPRTAAKTFEFMGYRVEKGSRVLVGTGVTHFLPQYFPDPHTFDIERYIEPRQENRQALALVPFSLGEHTCLGAGLAEVLVMTNIAALIRSLDLELDPPDYQVRIKAAPSRGPQPDLAVRVRA